jgi:hypothetical protein
MSIRSAREADCWIIRDPLSSRYTKDTVLGRFKAVRDGCVFWQPGGKNPRADSWEIWEMGVIRPDWVLADTIKIVHPPLRDGQWRYFAPETWGGDADAGQH